MRICLPEKPGPKQFTSSLTINPRQLKTPAPEPDLTTRLIDQLQRVVLPEKEEFQEYVKELRDPKSTDLRSRVRKKMDDLAKEA